MTLNKKAKETIILGAGITGLSASYVSGLPVYESTDNVGGICNSYYMRKNSEERLESQPMDDESYRFENGGGHWIFGGDPSVIRMMRSLATFKNYPRKASVFLEKDDLFIPYPIQNNLSYLDKKISKRAFKEIEKNYDPSKAIKTFKDWLSVNFGKSLCDIFFHPFNNLYTAGLYKIIAPQDGYKSPVNKEDIRKGFLGNSNSVGYNTTFIYPENGLDELMRRLKDGCKINFSKEVIKIDLKNKTVHFSDKSFVSYKEIISTIPLDKMIQITGIKIAEKFNPSTSVLVLNIGAKKGESCPKDHWVYMPHSKAGFHRVGFYSNVDQSFLPKSHRGGNYVSIYVEKAYQKRRVPSKKEVDEFSKDVISEIKELGWVSEVEVFDPTWIETAYTWSYPKSKWREKSLRELERNNIYQIGRYGRWVFQGLADSIKDGLMIGAAFMQKNK